jgi:hypothetical protein
MRAFKSARTLLLLVAVLSLGAGCTKDSPTEPARTTPSAPIPAEPVLTYSVTVTANPPSIQIGTNNSSVVTVQVRRNDTGQAPADLTPVTLSTTLGEFGSVGSGQTSVDLQLVGGQAQAILYSGTSAGSATVRALVTGTTSAGATNVQIGQQSTFFVSSVTPSVGNPDGGEEVTIQGGGFDGPVRVTFNGAAATVRSVSANSIRVVVPSATAAGINVGVGQSVPVSVAVTINVNETGQTTDTLANGFTYSLATSVRQPQVFSISPTSGSNDGGTRIVIVGQGFESPVQVFFGTGAASSFDGVEATIQSVSANQIVVTSPPARGFGLDNQNRIVDVLVKNVNSGFSTVGPQLFRYGVSVQITSFAPGRAIYNQPTTVTIFGQGFDEPVAVGLGGFAAQVLSVTGSEIVVRSPAIRVSSCAAVSGPVTVTNIDTGNTASTQGTIFTYDVLRPLITNISPTSGAENGNSQVSITGSNFTPPLRVVIGGQAASVLSSNANQVVVSTPRFTGTFPTQPCDDNGDGTQGQRNLPTSVDVQITNLETTCTDTFTRAFTYNPADTTCRNDNGTPPASPECSDGIDNDGDGLIDFGPLATNDPQCLNASDSSEAS